MRQVAVHERAIKAARTALTKEQAVSTERASRVGGLERELAAARRC